MIPSALRQSVLLTVSFESPRLRPQENDPRSVDYSPFMDWDIDNTLRLCLHCEPASGPPPKEEFVSWSTPTSLCSFIQVGYAESINGTFYLVLVDAYFKCLKISRVITYHQKHLGLPAPHVHTE